MYVYPKHPTEREIRSAVMCMLEMNCFFIPLISLGATPGHT